MKKLFPYAFLALFVIASGAKQSFSQNLPTDKAGKNLTLEEIWSEWKFTAESVSGVRSMSDGLHYTSLEKIKNGSAVVKYSYKTGEAVDTIAKSAALIPEGAEKPIDIEEYQFSADENKLLIATDVEPIYRHSTREINYIYDTSTKKLTLLSENKQRYATFSPSGNKVAFVRGNNLFVKDLENGNETQITTDGEHNKIINGATDWVYEEEFGFDKAFFWSPDGKKIAFYRFDESSVREFNMTTYGTLYPADYRFKYPKCGEKNSKLSIHIFDLGKGKTIDVDLGNNWEYIARIKWTKDPEWFSIQQMNRHQNRLDFILANASSGETKTIFTETSDTYIDITNNLTFLDDKKHFIWTSEKSDFNHIYLYDISGKEVRQITKGNWDVTDFKGFNEKTKTLFYISAESSPLERDLYSIKNDGSGKKKLSTKKGSNSVVFSNGFRYYINYHSDANTPHYISLNDARGKELRMLKNNKKLADTLATYRLSKKEFFSFKTSEGVELNGWMIKPADFDQGKKYPVFMFVYGGPGSQTVRNSWGGTNQMWYQLLTQKGYIVVSVDNRGTGARGRDFKNCTYKQLGKLETIDQIEAAKHLGSLPYVDKTRIGIQGWSYGGYMSSLCLFKGNDYFKTAIAVAPVTNWRYYDTIYTERYMQTPQENADGYDDNSPINHVDSLCGKYLLVHGMADDNVHFQNSVEMVNALVKANKQFDFYMYPDKNHGIYGGNTRLHLFTKMTNFILNNL
ncbi:S9 family peptidase [Bacteroidales bacterium AH-315-I05]|nr:S9 family peptidase [Bacteroidales bacterium AH-315-I05]